MPTIDLNADLGEGFGRYRVADEEAVLPLVTSASIACGFHAGDPVTMRESVAAALRHGVVVGAHPGYPDLLGFGRRALAASADEVTAYVLYQIGALAAVCRAAGTTLRFVKPHGALYNRAAVDDMVAGAVAEAVRLADPSLVLLGLAGSSLTAAGERHGLRTVGEAFADRAYMADGTLAPRSLGGAVLTDEMTVVRQALSIVRTQRAPTIDGGECTVRAGSLCVHGDNPRAVALLQALRTQLAADGVAIASFADR